MTLGELGKFAIWVLWMAQNPLKGIAGRMLNPNLMKLSNNGLTII